MGVLFGKLGKTGIDKQVLEQMGEDKFLAAVASTSAKLVRSNLTAAQEEKLKNSFGTEKHEKQAWRRTSVTRRGGREAAPSSFAR